MTDDRQGVEMLRQAIEEVAESLPAPGVPRAVPRPDFFSVLGRNLRPALAAGIVLLILGYPAFRGLFELPRLESEIAALRAAPVDLYLVSLPRPSSQLRSTGTATPVETVRVPSRRPWLLLVEIPPEWLERQAATSYRLEFGRPDGDSLRSWEVDSTRLRQLLETRDAVPLLMSAAEALDGTYRLDLTPREAALEAGGLSVLIEVVSIP